MSTGRWGLGTVQIALDNVSYEIDLSAANAERLREKLARFVENGKKVTTRPRGRELKAGMVLTRFGDNGCSRS